MLTERAVYWLLLQAREHRSLAKQAVEQARQSQSEAAAWECVKALARGESAWERVKAYSRVLGLPAWYPAPDGSARRSNDPKHLRDCREDLLRADVPKVRPPLGEDAPR